MFSAYVPARFTQISRSFARTDKTAWIVTAASVVTGTLVCAVFFLA